MYATLSTAQGRLVLPSPAAREIGCAPWNWFPSFRRHLLLTLPEEGSAVTLAGRLGEISVTDLLSFFNMFRKTGILRFDLSGGIKDLYFQQGEIVFAASTFPDEDIGEVLLPGKSGPGTLQKVSLSSQRPRATWANSWWRREIVAPRDLWLADPTAGGDHRLPSLHLSAGEVSPLVQKDLEKEEIRPPFHEHPEPDHGRAAAGRRAGSFHAPHPLPRRHPGSDGPGQRDHG